MADILGMMDYIGRRTDQGVQTGKQNRLAGLYQQALQGPRDQRSGLIAQMAGVSPQAAFDAEKHFGGMDDNARQRLGQYAAAFDALPDEQKPQAYPQLAAQAQELGIPAPSQWDPSYASNIQKLAQSLGGVASGSNVQSRFVGEDGQVYALMRNGGVQPLGIKADPSMQIVEGEGGFFGVNKRNLAANPVQLGGAPQQRAPGEVPFSIDPSLPQPVQAAIRANEGQFAQAQDGSAVQIGGNGQLRPAPPKVSPAEQTRLAFEAERLRMAQEDESRKAQQFQQQQQLGGMTPQQAFKLQTAKRKEAALLTSGEVKLDQTISLIDDILKRKSDFGGVTGMGAMGARIPGTDWADLANKLETLKARSAFGSLQEMRANSPTGGALGSVTERELALLQNAETQLGNSQSPGSLEQALKQYKLQLQASKKRMRSGLEEFYQDVPQADKTEQQARSALPPGFSWED